MNVFEKPMRTLALSDKCAESYIAVAIGKYRFSSHLIGIVVALCLLMKAVLVVNLVRSGIERLGTRTSHVLIMCLPALILLVCSSECFWTDVDTLLGVRLSLALHIGDAVLQLMLSSKAVSYLYQTGRGGDMARFVSSSLSLGTFCPFQ